ncbi:M20/M25/M40 family metallo-hydrolase [Sphingomonas sp. AP4-R1]|uniref:M20/M25/M40 family metallo-hydrolase n=1 Tax=Sphingomonas sp. AP4-R1 TaxID=2735134 RepID=UPI0014933AD5|nr:M20/M25/M40 family metallo-hydrolase [Sphingomonas sp. AP4-R1]QJU59401.1 M20/M25/M40 family metallo-hydrolase [Sphingomonas sp. AP4-R1]
MIKRPLARTPFLFTAAALLGTSTIAFSAIAASPDPATLREAALQDDTAWDILEGITTEVGQRLAATPAEARAREWAVAELKRQGFANVHVETFTMPVWQRGEETAEIVAPFPQKLAVAALGNSSGTPAGGLTAEVAAFDGLDALVKAPASAVAGKIVFVNHHMAAQQDGGSYGEIGAIRRTGPSIASQKGALAIVIRSIGTDHHRVPHTGVQTWVNGAKAIPAAALSVPDAEQLARVLERGKPVTLHLSIGAGMAGTGTSGNVIAEVPGRDPKAGIVLVGGHLDSWDLATGTIDDASGLAIVTAAAKRIMAAGKPRRTIRIVWFGAEEPGGFGGDAYAKAHAGEKHVLVGESDSGADRVWKVDFTAADPKAPLADRIALALAPLGITRGSARAHGGTDVGPIAQVTGAPVIDLHQDATRYFDIHHTADDTLDKVDPAQLRQNVAAWTAMLAIAAEDAEQLAPVAPAPER